MNKPLNEQQIERTRKLVMDYAIAAFDAGPGRMVNTAWVVEQLHELAKLPLDASVIINGGLSVGADGPEPFQSRVQPWMLECFGAEISADAKERNHRFLEESLELVQSCGCTPAEAHQLVDYVYGRPVGEKAQEVGGVMVTLAALCLAQQLDMHDCGEVELVRIWTKVPQIRAKQAAKPKHSPLPEAAPILHQTASTTDNELCALDYAVRALRAIAERKELVGDLIEPMNDIRSASRRAQYALSRLEPVVGRLMAHNASEHEVETPANSMEQRIRTAIASLEKINVTPENISAIEKLIAATKDATGTVSE